MSKPSLLPLAPGEIIDHLQYRPVDLGDYHLGDSVSIPYGKWFLAEIDDENANLPTVIRIDRSWSVD